MGVPLLDLTRENRPLWGEISQKVEQIADSSQFILGKAVSDFESQISSYFHLSDHFALGVSSGTDALLMALHVLDFPIGKNIITTPYTFYATSGVIHRAGLVPRYVDIKPGSFNIDPEKIKSAINKDTVAIMPVHLYGQPADMDEINQIAREHNLVVIEDNAQALGAEYKGRPTGTLGDMAGISFFPTKNLGAFGDAGLMIGKNQYKEKSTRVRVHGMQDRYDHVEIGGNFRMDALQAAILSVKLPHLADWNGQRRENAKLYQTLFQKKNLSSIITIPVEEKDRTHIYHQYVVRAPEESRNDLKKYLDEKQIGNMVYYPKSLHEQKPFAYLGYKLGDFPESEKATRQVLALPIHQSITSLEIEEVVSVIADFYGK